MSRGLKIVLAILVALIIVPIILVVTGNLGYGSIRTGWIGSNYGDHISYSYSSFTGHETSNYDVSSASTLTIDYEFIVNVGSLDMQVINLANDEVIWEQNYQQNVDNQIELDVSSIDRVQIRVTGNGTQGNFDIRPLIE